MFTVEEKSWNMSTHRPLSSSFVGLPYRILNISHEKELLRGLWVKHKGSQHESSRTKPPKPMFQLSGIR